MELTILGSGTGIPALEKNAAGLIIKLEDENLLFDTGPGILKKLLEIGLTYHDIDRIFYTHFHTDHTLDLASFLFAAKYAISLRIKDIDLIGPFGLKRFYEGLLHLYGDVVKPEAYKVNVKEIAEETLKFKTCTVETMKMQHTPASLGYRINSGGKTVAYSGDTDVCENVIKLGQGADILILECSFPDQMKVKGHLIPQEAGRIARACNCKKLVLSHLYPVCIQYDIAKQARAAFRGKVIVASDLMRLTV